MKMSRRFKIALSLSLFFIISVSLLSCGGGDKGGLLGIIIHPLGAIIDVGDTKQFRATGYWDDPNSSDMFAAIYRDITNEVTWVSSNSEVATINSSGLATGVAEGSTAIISYLEGKEQSVPLTVTAPPSATVGWY